MALHSTMRVSAPRSGSYVKLQARRPARVGTIRVQAMARSMPVRWETVHEYLATTKQMRSVAPKTAKEMANSGEWVLVDVRLPGQYAASHAEGSVSVPMYQPLDWTKPDAVKVLKFIAFSFNGVTPVEINPDFAEQIKAVAAGGKGVITVCEAGGTLRPSVNFPAGKSSRSLQAAYKALVENVTLKVAHLDRGLFGWFQSDFPFSGEGEYTPEIGRTPMAAGDPTMTILREARGYEVRESDKKPLDK